MYGKTLPRRALPSVIVDTEKRSGWVRRRDAVVFVRRMPNGGWKVVAPKVQLKRTGEPARSPKTISVSQIEDNGEKSIEQDLRGKNFGARNGNYERDAVVKNQGTKQGGQRILGDCWQCKANGQCSKGDNCSFRHDINQRAKRKSLNLQNKKDEPEACTFFTISWMISNLRVLSQELKDQNLRYSTRELLQH